METLFSRCPQATECLTYKSYIESISFCFRETIKDVFFLSYLLLLLVLLLLLLLSVNWPILRNQLHLFWKTHTKKQEKPWTTSNMAMNLSLSCNLIVIIKCWMDSILSWYCIIVVPRTWQFRNPLLSFSSRFSWGSNDNLSNEASSLHQHRRSDFHEDTSHWDLICDTSCTTRLLWT